MLARGAPLLTDSFEYTNGPLVTVSGGKWVHHSPSGSSTGQVDVVSGRVFLNQSEAEDVSALLQGAPYPASADLTVYAGFSVNFSSLPDGAASSYFAHFKDNTTSGFRARIFTTTNGAPAGMLRIGVANSASSPTAVLTNDLSLGSDHTVVIRYVISNASTTVWLDPASELSPGLTATDSASALGISAFALRQPGSINDGVGYGNLYFDNLAVGSAFADATTTPTNRPPVITTQPQSVAVAQGDSATFTVVVTGSAPLSYQWQFHSTNLAGATGSALVVTNATAAAAGPYSVTVTNSLGSTGSQPATLTVTNPPAVPAVLAFSLMTYNTAGFGTTNWSTNAPQAQAIGRQLQYLQPDIVTFQEIPYTNTWQMTNWVTAFLPGYFLATNSVTDGILRSAIASRFPITRSTSWLPHADLSPFGYTNANFTRDLFEAQISVFGFPQPLHVFTAHLKSGTTDADDAARRAAEASAISNFFVLGFLTTNALHPYLLTGDLNEDIAHPATGSQQPIQRLTNGTGLQLTTPRNPASDSEQTFSIRGVLDRRYDYLLPCGLLFSNIAGSQVFRTDLLANPPPPLLANDDATASDHLPVLMVFNSPYDKPFRLLSITRSDPSLALTWQSVPGQPYRVESSSNLAAWAELASNLVASGTSYLFATHVTGSTRFFRVYRVP
jgi:endonuclease/exonuclease/phosphatase family metal-dependent hydrolase